MTDILRSGELRALRRERQLTQVELAKLLGYHSNYIAQLERGVVPMSEKFIRHLFAELRRMRKPDPMG